MAAGYYGNFRAKFKEALRSSLEDFTVTLVSDEWRVFFFLEDFTVTLVSDEWRVFFFFFHVWSKSERLIVVLPLY